MSIFQNINNMTQREFVEMNLLEHGYIDRNFCLQNYITRLGAIIGILKNDNWVFETSRPKISTPWGIGRDYRYTLVKEGLRYKRRTEK